MSRFDISATSMSRRSLLKVAGVGAASLGVTQLLSACGGGSSTGSAVVSGSPISGGSLTVAVTSVGAGETLSPAGAYTPSEFLKILNIYDSLYVRDESGQAVPSLVENAESNDTATLWTFRLKSGITWHDGSDLTADDLVYTVKSWGDSSHAGYGAMSPFVDFANVRAVDGLTVEIPLILGCAEFPTLTVYPSFVVIQEGSDPAQTSIGTGAFTLGSFEAGSRAVLTANPDYWQEGKPYLDELVIDSNYTDDQARVNALLSAEADVLLQFPYDLAVGYRDSGEIQVLTAEGPAAQVFAMDLSQAPFNDPRVVQAVKLLVDREALVQTVLNGFGTAAHDLAPSTSPYFAAELTVERDLDQARSLLKAAGLEGGTIEMTTSTAFAGQLAASTLFKAQAAEAGLTVELNQIDPTTFYTSDAGWLNYPISPDYWSGAMTSMTSWYMNSLYTGAPYNQTHWGDASTDQLLLSAMAETDETAAAQKWLDVQQAQFDTGGYVVWGNMNYVDGAANTVGGLQATAAGNLGGFRMQDVWVTG